MYFIYVQVDWEYDPLYWELHPLHFFLPESQFFFLFQRTNVSILALSGKLTHLYIFLIKTSFSLWHIIQWVLHSLELLSEQKFDNRSLFKPGLLCLICNYFK